MTVSLPLPRTLTVGLVLGGVIFLAGRCAGKAAAAGGTARTAAHAADSASAAARSELASWRAAAVQTSANVAKLEHHVDTLTAAAAAEHRRGDSLAQLARAHRPTGPRPAPVVAADSGLAAYADSLADALALETAAAAAEKARGDSLDLALEAQKKATWRLKTQVAVDSFTIASLDAARALEHAARIAAEAANGCGWAGRIIGCPDRTTLALSAVAVGVVGGAVIAHHLGRPIQS